MSKSNQKRIFESIVSVDAWRTAFCSTSSTASVHVDVSFLSGRLGDDAISPVRFELTLKRAEIVFIIPHSEPLKVLQPTVAREKPSAVRKSISQKVESSRAASGSLKVQISRESDVQGEAHLSASKARTTVETQETNVETNAISWSQSKTPDGHYRWDVSPEMAPYLLGKVWDAVAEPILSIKNISSTKSAIEAVCRIEIRCKREDIVISNLRSKKSGSLGSRIFDNKKAAAEAYIRNSLASRNLDIRNFEDPYGDVTLADVVIDHQVT